MKKWFFVMLIILVIIAACTKHDLPVSEGNAAPDFTLEDLSGKLTRLSDLKGKVVLLNFWATWCPPCREEIPSMMKLNKAMEGKSFQMLAVSVDEGGKNAVEKYFNESSNVLPVLLDTDNTISKKYGTTGVPETFVIDKKGVILKKIVGGVDWSDPQVISYINDIISR